MTRLFEWFGVLFTAFGIEGWDAGRLISRLNGVVTTEEIEGMPPQLSERQYYRQTASAGLELLIVQNGSPGGWWAVVLLNMDIGEVELAKRTVKPQPERGISYTSSPVLSNEAREEVAERVEAALQAKTRRR